MKLAIQYMTYDTRHHTFSHFIRLLNESRKKHEWVLVILTHKEDEAFYAKEMNKYDIKYTIQRVPDDGGNYINKVRYCIQFSCENNIPYIMKCDNDILLKPDTLDYMIENLDLLQNPQFLTLGPTLTSGVPSYEYFAESFLDEGTKYDMNKMFLETDFRQALNYNQEYYWPLNQHTIDAKTWDKHAFFKKVYEIDTVSKGIHPIRANHKSLQRLNEYIIQNKSRFMKNHDLSVIDTDTSPYLCNSIFCIRTEVYYKIAFLETTYDDIWEEITLNKHAWNNNMRHLFVKNGFAIHIAYNTMPNHYEYEKYFCEKFFTND